MPEKLADAVVKTLPVPEHGNKITYDGETAGFGCRVTAAGARSFVLNYRTRAGRERRYTIGSFPDWKTTAARAEAIELKKRIDRGEDPLGDIEADREAPTIANLAERYEADHLPKKRPRSQEEDRRNIRNHILPRLKHAKVAEISFADIDGLHRRITRDGSPYAANRTIALLSKMFSLAIKWGWRSDNPVRGVERNQEHKRTRYLSSDELDRLTAALADHEDQQAANIIRMLLLSGARRGEVLAARWDQFDLTNGVWTKPGSTTKQKTEHRVPLSAEVCQILSGLPVEGEYVFPGRGSPHRVDIKKDWATICRAAKISGVRIHDLRHSFASMLASAGLSLPVIGALLGHSQPATTHRYAHLFDDPLRAATEHVAAIVTKRF